MHLLIDNLLKFQVRPVVVMQLFELPKGIRAHQFLFAIIISGIIILWVPGSNNQASESEAIWIT